MVFLDKYIKLVNQLVSQSFVFRDKNITVVVIAYMTYRISFSYFIVISKKFC